MSPAQLLLLEDDPQLRDVLVRSLRAEGFDIRAVRTASELLERVSAGLPDAFVIDIGLPDADGRDVCQALRARGIDTPVLFLTARDTLADRLSGFGAGGDDYVSKPFDIAEVAARLEALMRRARPESPAAEDGGLRLDPAELSVSVGSCTQALTPTEFRLLAALAARPGSAV